MRKHVHVVKWLFVVGITFFLTLSAAAQWSNVGGNVSFNNTYPGNYCFARDSKDTCI